MGDSGGREWSCPRGATFTLQGRRAGGAPGLPSGRGGVAEELMKDGKHRKSVREHSVAFQTCWKRHASHILPSRISAGKKQIGKDEAL